MGYGAIRGIDGSLTPASLKTVINNIHLDHDSDIFLDAGCGFGSVFHMLHFWGKAPRGGMIGFDFDPVKASHSLAVREKIEEYFNERGHPMSTSPRLRLLCADVQYIKTIEPATVVYAGGLI